MNLDALEIPGEWWAAWMLRAIPGLVLTFLFVQLAHRRSAALRHSLLSIGLLGSLALPLVLPLVRGHVSPLRLAVLPNSGGVQSEQVSMTVPPIFGQLSAPVVPPLSTPFEAGQSPTAVAWQAGLLRIGFSVWLIGLFVLCVRRLRSEFALVALERASVPCGCPVWRAMAESIGESYGLGRQVRLVVHSEAQTPATWGTRRPVLLLPSTAQKWSVDRRRAVLLHELAHVRRRDVLLNRLTGIARDVHWCNPLAWVMLRQLNRLREEACDDEVLAQGAKPSRYAGFLLSLARRGHSLPPRPALALQRGPSELERRLTHILGTMDKPALHRNLPRGRFFFSAALLALAVLPALSVELVAQTDRVGNADAQAAPGQEIPAPKPTVEQSSKEAKPDAKPDAMPDPKPKAQVGANASEVSDAKPKPVPDPRASAQKGRAQESESDRKAKQEHVPSDKSPIWVGGLPSEAELARLAPGLDRGVLLDALQDVRVDGAGLSGLPTDQDLAEHPCAGLTAKDIERIVRNAVKQVEEAHPNAKVKVQGVGWRIIEVPKAKPDAAKDSDALSDPAAKPKARPKAPEPRNPAPKPNTRGPREPRGRGAALVPPQPLTPPVPVMPLGPVKLTRAEGRLPRATLFLRTHANNDYLRATYNFRYGTRDDAVLVRNNWDLQVSNYSNSPEIQVFLVADDRGGIVDLGDKAVTKVTKNERKLRKFHLTRTAALERGHTYVMHTLDRDFDYWTAFKVVSIDEQGRVELAWRLLRDDSGFVAGYPRVPKRR